MKKIKLMEVSMHQSLKKRNDLITNRRQNDVKDESGEISSKNVAGKSLFIKVLFTVVPRSHREYTCLYISFLISWQFNFAKAVNNVRSTK